MPKGPGNRAQTNFFQSWIDRISSDLGSTELFPTLAQANLFQPWLDRIYSNPGSVKLQPTDQLQLWLGKVRLA